MGWELLAIWSIVIGTVIWFVRDEKRRIADAAIARSARYYAHADRVHGSIEPAAVPVPVRRPGGLTTQQRAFIATYSSIRSRAASQDLP